METQYLINLVSLTSSAVATVLTIYFWLVRAQRERPWLAVYLAPGLGADQSSSGSGTEGAVTCHYYCRAVLANYSSLPNAVIGIRAWLRSRDRGWLAARVETEARSSVPFNLAPMQTCAVDLALSVELPGSLSGSTTASRKESALGSVGSPLALKVELLALGERRFTQILEVPK
ncbi:MAG: hypothetical protein HY720_18955 [Planctomycetes bacterium]|nr:hypothetical protein [Planctomycetota bacterium]